MQAKKNAGQDVGVKRAEAFAAVEAPSWNIGKVRDAGNKAELTGLAKDTR